jgi:curved DNA-binding protein CbpA
VSGEPDPYEVLQVRTDAGEDVIRAAYRALARRHHPDTSVDAASVPQMVLVNWAWEILSNPERRSRYDREHGVVARPTTPAPAAHPPASWSAPSGAGPAGSAPSGAGGAGGAGTAAGTSGTASGTGPSRRGFGGGRPPIQRRGADGQVIEWRSAPDGTGGAGEPPGRPSGTVLPFGRFIAWSIGEIARYDPGYLEWLDGRPDGAPYRDEIDATLKRIGWRQTPASRDKPKRWGR